MRLGSLSTFLGFIRMFLSGFKPIICRQVPRHTHCRLIYVCWRYIFECVGNGQRTSAEVAFVLNKHLFIYCFLRPKINSYWMSRACVVMNFCNCAVRHAANKLFIIILFIAKRHHCDRKKKKKKKHYPLKFVSKFDGIDITFTETFTFFTDILINLSNFAQNISTKEYDQAIRLNNNLLSYFNEWGEYLCNLAEKLLNTNPTLELLCSNRFYYALLLRNECGKKKYA